MSFLPLIIGFSMDHFSGFSYPNIQDIVLTPLTHFSVIAIPERTFISRLNRKSRTHVPFSAACDEDRQTEQRRSKSKEIRLDLKKLAKMCSIE